MFKIVVTPPVTVESVGMDDDSSCSRDSILSRSSSQDSDSDTEQDMSASVSQLSITPPPSIPNEARPVRSPAMPVSHTPDLMQQDNNEEEVYNRAVARFLNATAKNKGSRSPKSRYDTSSSAMLPTSRPDEFAMAIEDDRPQAPSLKRTDRYKLKYFNNRHTDSMGYLLPPVANNDLTGLNRGDSFWVGDQGRQSMDTDTFWGDVIDAVIMTAQSATSLQPRKNE